MLLRSLLRKSAAPLFCGAALGAFSVASAQAAPADDPFAAPAASSAAPAKAAAPAAAPAPAAPAAPAPPPATSAAADPFSPSFGDKAPATSGDAAGVVDPFSPAKPAVAAAAPAVAAPAAAAAAPPAVATGLTGAAAAPAAASSTAGGAFTGVADPFGGSAAPPPGAVPNPNLVTAVSVQTGSNEEPNPFGLAEKTADASQTTGAGISRVYQFRYLEAARADGTRGVVRKQMTKEEADAFDQKIFLFYHQLIDRGQLTSYVAGADSADDWAQWMMYSYQLKLWQQYCETIALVGANLDKSTTVVKWPGTVAVAAPGQGGVVGIAGGDVTGGKGGIAGGSPPPPANIYNENRSLDNQLKDFNPLPDTRAGSQGKVVLDPKVMDDQAVRVYQTYLTTLRGFEKDQAKFMQDLKASLDQREAGREAYREWRTNQLAEVKDFVSEWNRRYEGQVTTIAGVRYELYRPESAPTHTTRGANVVITDYELTPYDLLNSDGTLRGPAKQ